MEPPVDQLAKPPENPPIAIPANPGESRLIPERPGKISRRQGAMDGKAALMASLNARLKKGRPGKPKKKKAPEEKTEEPKPEGPPPAPAKRSAPPPKPVRSGPPPAPRRSSEKSRLSNTASIVEPPKPPPTRRSPKAGFRPPRPSRKKPQVKTEDLAIDAKAGEPAPVRRGPPSAPKRKPKSLSEAPPQRSPKPEKPPAAPPRKSQTSESKTEKGIEEENLELKTYIREGMMDKKAGKLRSKWENRYFCIERTHDNQYDLYWGKRRGEKETGRLRLSGSQVTALKSDLIEIDAKERLLIVRCSSPESRQGWFESLFYYASTKAIKDPRSLAKKAGYLTKVKGARRRHFVIYSPIAPRYPFKLEYYKQKPVPGKICVPTGSYFIIEGSPGNRSISIDPKDRLSFEAKVTADNSDGAIRGGHYRSGSSNSSQTSSALQEGRIHLRAESKEDLKEWIDIIAPELTAEKAPQVHVIEEEPSKPEPKTKPKPKPKPEPVKPKPEPVKKRPTIEVKSEDDPEKKTKPKPELEPEPEPEPEPERKRPQQFVKPTTPADHQVNLAMAAMAAVRKKKKKVEPQTSSSSADPAPAAPAAPAAPPQPAAATSVAPSPSAAPPSQNAETPKQFRLPKKFKKKTKFHLPIGAMSPGAQDTPKERKATKPSKPIKPTKPSKPSTSKSRPLITPKEKKLSQTEPPSVPKPKPATEGVAIPDDLLGRVTELQSSMAMWTWHLQLQLEENKKLRSAFKDVSRRLGRLHESADKSAVLESVHQVSPSDEGFAKLYEEFKCEKVYYQGEVMKEGFGNHRWNRRWVMLTASMVSYGDRDQKPKGIFRLTNSTVSPYGKVEKTTHECVEIKLPDYSKAFRFYSPSMTENERWFGAIHARVTATRYRHECSILMQIPDAAILRHLDLPIDGPPTKMMVNGKALSFQLLGMVSDLIGGVPASGDAKAKRLPVGRAISEFECKNAGLSARKMGTILSAALRDPQKSLRRIDLSGNEMKESQATLTALQDLKLLAPAARDSKLSTVLLNTCGIGPTVAGLLAEIVVSSGGAFGSKLYLTGNNICDDGVTRCIQTFAQSGVPVTCLDLGFNSLGPKGITTLASSLSKLPKLSELSIKGSAADDKSMTALCDAVCAHSTLSSLDVAETRLSDKGATSLAHLAQRSGNLRRLLFLNEQLDDSALGMLRLLHQAHYGQGN
ncbi:hypothetical protein AAMO2058_001699500 [Amorphochlora amoebiformis]